jgi:hypothetical protein
VPNEAEALRTGRGETGPTRCRTKIRVLPRRGDDTSHSFMSDASEPPEKLPWELMRISRKRRKRECNSSTDEPHSLVLALS